MKDCDCTSRASISAQRRNRRGGVLIFVVLALVLVSLSATAIVQLTAVQHRQSQQLEQRQQEQWLAESAIRRASHNLQTSTDYRTETWQIPAGTLATAHQYEVRIEAVPVNDQPNRITVRVEVVATEKDAIADVKLRLERNVEISNEPRPPM